MAGAVRAAALLGAALIALSGAAEPRRCYWCGPLAEQVHRSRRSAPCGASAPVTACEPGYEHCAVVATSPPRVESRFCVKLYQDECYPLFCNSTKTWKMTCPCRGDLCNGPNTPRETEAFALLHKLVAKTHNARIKKRTAIATPHLIKPKKTSIIGVGEEPNDPDSNPSDKLIVNEDDVGSKSDADSKPEEMQSDQPTNIVVEHHDDGKENAENVAENKDNDQPTTPDQLIEIEIHVSDPTDLSVTVKEDEPPCTNSDVSSTSEPDKPAEVTETEKHEEVPITTIATPAESTEAPVKSTENMNVAQSDEPTKPTEAMQQDVVTVKITAETTPELPAVPSEITPSEPVRAIDEMQNDAPAINPTDGVQTMKPTEEAKVVEQSTMKSVKASEGIPTAEALQQNGSPAAVNTEKTTPVPTTEAATSTTIVTTQENMIKNFKITTTPASRRKNSATQIKFSFALLLSCIVYF